MLSEDNFLCQLTTSKYFSCKIFLKNDWTPFYKKLIQLVVGRPNGLYILGSMILASRANRIKRTTDLLFEKFVLAQMSL